MCSRVHGIGDVGHWVFPGRDSIHLHVILVLVVVVIVVANVNVW
jgi:hypothetical protein